MELAEEFEKSMSLSHSSATNVLYLTSDPAASALLASSYDEQEMAEEDEDVDPDLLLSLPTLCMLEVMERATERLDLPWKCRGKEVPSHVHTEIEMG